ncbi:MAG: helix-turn-helix transcriptional regulator [Arcticibacter sp.]
MATVNQIIRLLLIIRKIKSQRPAYPTLKQIIQYVKEDFEIRGIQSGLSDRSFQKDIENIRTQFGIDIVYCQQNQGYRIEQNYEALLNIEQILEPFEIFNALHGHTELSEYVKTEPYQPAGTHYLSKLIYAIKNTLRINITYMKFGTQEPTVRTLHPYLIRQFRRRWYVVGRLESTSEFKTFGLDRILDLEIGKEHFFKDPHFSYDMKFKNSFGIYASDEGQIDDVELSFSEFDGNYIKSSPLHHSQRILKDDESGLRIALKLKITDDFIMELLSLSSSLAVVKPAWLKQKMVDVYDGAMARNSEYTEQNY